MPLLRLLLPVVAGACVVINSELTAAGEDIFLAEDFSTSPAARGWQSFGNPNLFSWNSSQQNLQVTWDSSQPNSYFCRPLELTLTRSNDFIFGFDLRLTDIAIGVDPQKPYTFELAIGLINLASATNAAFIRGDQFGSRNLVEFDYFPDSGYGATLASTIISSNSDFCDGGFTYPLELTTNDLFHVELRFVAASQSLFTTITRNGLRYAFPKPAALGQFFSDFQVDHISISSYSDAGQWPDFAGSLLAHGTVDNIVFLSSPPVAEVRGNFAGTNWIVQFSSHTGWLYQLEASPDNATWNPASASKSGTGGTLALTNSGPVLSPGFFRVRAQRP